MHIGNLSACGMRERERRVVLSYVKIACLNAIVGPCLIGEWSEGQQEAGQQEDVYSEVVASHYHCSCTG